MQLMRKNRRNPSGAEAAEMIEENYQNNSTCKGQASSCERSLHQSAQGPGPGPARAGGGGGEGGDVCVLQTLRRRNEGRCAQVFTLALTSPASISRAEKIKS